MNAEYRIFVNYSHQGQCLCLGVYLYNFQRVYGKYFMHRLLLQVFATKDTSVFLLLCFWFGGAKLRSPSVASQ